jgi:hypothetical protein
MFCKFVICNQKGNKVKRKVMVFAMAAVVLCAATGFGDALSDFDGLTLGEESYWNGSDGSGGFTSGGASFNNNYTPAGGGYDEYWDGFAYSNRTDTETLGYAYAQYVSAPGDAHSGDNYAIGYQYAMPTITLSYATVVDSLQITNVNHTVDVINNGDAAFFTDPLGADDWFKVTITGKDILGDVIGTEDVYLADFRDGLSFVSTDWMEIDLTGLGAVKSLEFSMSGSDMVVGPGYSYLNTPGYFAIDSVVPEPVSIMLLGVGCMFARNRRNSKR